jgi:hypothetical protein
VVTRIFSSGRSQEEEEDWFEPDVNIHAALSPHCHPNYFCPFVTQYKKYSYIEKGLGRHLPPL